MTEPSSSNLRAAARQRLVWRILGVVCAGVIFFFSTEPLGASATLRALAWILRSLHLSLAPPSLDLLNKVVRKLAHLTEYAGFGFILYHCFPEAHRSAWQLRPAVRALGVAALYSLGDEFHQSFVPGRGASLVDCGIDTAGAALAILGLYAKQRLWPISDDATPQTGRRK